MSPALLHYVRMVAEENGLFLCELCGLKYRDAETAEECESWDRKHDSCNLEIAKKSVE